MKKIAVLIALITFVTGCKKRNIIGPEPSGWSITERDTVTSGQYWGINIGDDRATVYSKIRTLRQEKMIPALLLQDFHYTSLTAVKDKLPFYNTLNITRVSSGSVITVQFLFTNETVSLIYSSPAGQLNSWPADVDAGTTIRLGDNLATLYNKLAAISNQPLYAGYFKQVRLLNKNLDRDYEEGMSLAGSWKIESHTEEKVITGLELVFKNHSLDSVLIQKEEYTE